MDCSITPSSIYSVPAVRLRTLPVTGGRPTLLPNTVLAQSPIPASSINMLPYQGGSVPVGYTLVPNTMIMPTTPSVRPSFSVLDYEDEDVEEYVPIRPKKRSSDIINEIMESSEMDEFSAKTRQIRKDADGILQRLTATKPTSRASDFFKNYDYDRRPLTHRYPSPLPERASTRSPYLEEEEEPGSRWSYRGLTSLRVGTGLTPIGLTKERIRSVYQDLEEPGTSYKAPRGLDYSAVDFVPPPSRNPREVVKSEIQRKAMVSPPARSIARSQSLRSGRERIGKDASDVRNNISIRAHYAAMREAANRDVSIRKPKEVMP